MSTVPVAITATLPSSPIADLAEKVVAGDRSAVTKEEGVAYEVYMNITKEEGARVFSL